VLVRSMCMETVRGGMDIDGRKRNAHQPPFETRMRRSGLREARGVL